MTGDARRLMPGIYDRNGELHINLDEFIVAAGGDPGNPQDVSTAEEAIVKVAAEWGIPTDTVEDQ